jgi:hypothetical protein
MITLPKELYTSELVDIICIPNEEYENITLNVIFKKYPMHSEIVAHIGFTENNKYWINQFHYRLRDQVGSEIVDREVADVVVNIKNYLNILGFKDITL